MVPHSKEKFLASLKNIRIGAKIFARANTLAYFV
jgi:hypothetical protein